MGSENPGGNGAWQDANSNGNGLPGQLNDFRGVPFKAIALPRDLSRNGTMALPSKLRLLCVCATSLLCSGLAASAAPPAKSWFDEQLIKKTQALSTVAHTQDERSALVAIALLDGIYELRDEVSDPAAVDSLLKQQAGDSGTATSVQMEARYLLSLIKGERPEIANTQTIRASLEEVTTASATDVELLNAIESVCLFHHYVSPAAERADRLLNTQEAWYRRSKAASDD